MHKKQTKTKCATRILCELGVNAERWCGYVILYNSSNKIIILQKIEL